MTQSQHCLRFSWHLLWDSTATRSEECLTYVAFLSNELPLLTRHISTDFTRKLCRGSTFNYIVTLWFGYIRIGTVLSGNHVITSVLESVSLDELRHGRAGTEKSRQGFALILGGSDWVSALPAIAIFLSTRNTLILGSAMAVLSPIWAIFFMKESLSPENRIRSYFLSCMNPFSPMKILCKNRLYRILTPACGCVHDGNRQTRRSTSRTCLIFPPNSFPWHWYLWDRNLILSDRHVQTGRIRVRVT